MILAAKFIALWFAGSFALALLIGPVLRGPRWPASPDFPPLPDGSLPESAIERPDPEGYAL